MSVYEEALKQEVEKQGRYPCTLPGALFTEIIKCRGEAENDNDG